MSDAVKSAEKALRPRDAATLVLIDRSAGDWRVLVGKRSVKHVFMPDTYVFPGGRRDRRDHALPFESDLHPGVLQRLTADGHGRLAQPRARALALAALRELHEETGIVIGTARPAGHLSAHLSPLRYIARAITPPGSVRRFDTRFFAVFVDEAGVDIGAIRDSQELHDLRWIGLERDESIRMPQITRHILDELANLMETDPTLSYGRPVPFYYARYRKFIREEI